jgi:hypothetical protein
LLQILDIVEKKPEDEKKKEGEKKDAADENKSGEVEKEGEKEEEKDEQAELQKKAKEYLEAKGEENAIASASGGKKRKRKRTKEFDDESSGSESSDEEEVPPGMGKLKKEGEGEEKKAENGVKKVGEDGEAEAEAETETEKKEEEGEEKKNGDDEKMEEDKKEEEVDDGEPKPKPLHKTSSIFLRNLAPTITMQEIEAMCKRYPGFLRAAIADPDPARRWFRRGWVTFERGVKIKEICYNLNTIRLRDCELGPIVNRDLTRRIRTVNGITVDKKVVRNDIKLAAKVITNLDQRWGLWRKEKESNGASGEETEEGKKDDDNGEMTIGLGSNNPVLHNITDYLIEEASTEEEELLGCGNTDLEDGEEGEEGNAITRDDELLCVLDRMIFYLRIVHSIDFYNHSEYPNEDEMPNRCGIMHARSVPPAANVTQPEFDDYCATFEKKMGSFLQPRADLTSDESGKLGMKNEEDEVTLLALSAMSVTVFKPFFFSG